MSKIRVIVKDGSVVVDVSGVKGDGCDALTRALQDKLGTTTSSEKKSAYYDEPEIRVEHVTEGEGTGGTKW